MNLWRFNSYTLFSAAWMLLLSYISHPHTHTHLHTLKYIYEKVYRTILQRLDCLFGLLFLILYKWLSKSFVNTSVTNIHKQTIKRTIVLYLFCTLATKKNYLQCWFSMMTNFTLSFDNNNNTLHTRACVYYTTTLHHFKWFRSMSSMLLCIMYAFLYASK